MPGKVKDIFAEIDFSAVHNRNEKRVRKELEKLYAGLPETSRSPEAVQDIYALALNSLPARYTQPGSIVLREPVRSEQIQAAIRKAAEIVATQPKV